MTTFPTEKEWLEQNQYYQDLDESQLTSIFYFTLIWNLFEKKICKGTAKINTHAHELAKQYAAQHEEIINQIWPHFHDRYVENGQVKCVFENFVFNNSDNKEQVEKTLLKDEEATSSEKMEALLRIAFRLRNNLYHGKKNVEKLYGQNENFRQINRFLMTLIDASNN